MSAHPDVFAGLELGFIPEVMRLTQERMTGLIRSGATDQIMGEEKLKEATRAFFETIIQTRLDIEGKDVFSEKTPGNAMGFTHLIDAMPDARFIMVVRDPSDIINSMKSIAQRLRSQDSQREP